MTRRHPRSSFVRALPALVALVYSCQCGSIEIAAQDVVVQVADGQTVQFASPEDADKMKAAQAAAAQEAANQANKQNEGDKQPDGEKSDEEKKDGEKKDGDKSEDPAPVKRPAQPTFAPNPEELAIKPDADGRIRFSFHGQSWPDVLHWLAGVSGMSLDWQELPPDYLNLTTQRGYTLAEARDLINRHLLSRGFTLLEQGEVLMVVNLSKLDPSLVPRVGPDELEDHPPHAFVKVSFDLPNGLQAEAAMPDVKSMLSPNGKVHALKATNRLLVLDSVANLREARDTLYAEEASLEGNVVPRPFPLQYARAYDVATTLQDLLGIEAKSSGPKTQQEMQMEMQKQAMEMQMRQQNQNNNQGAAPPSKSDIYIVVDRRQNVVLVNAPPDKMRIIERAIKLLDVPSDNGASLTGNLIRMQAYRLVSLDPDVTVRMLTDVGNLDPHTQLTVDAKNKSIIAYATVADHMTIQSVIEKLDGAGRELEVVWLRRLRADEVAGTLQYLVVGEKKEEENNDDYGWGWYGRRNNQDEEPESEFRVDADVENNRLLLWANEIEMKLVRQLLAKLGEIPGESGDNRTVRVMHALPKEDADRVLEDLKRAWRGVSPNPIYIDGADKPKRTTDDASEETSLKKTPPEAEVAPKPDRNADAKSIDTLRFVQLVGDSPREDGEVARSERAPDESPTLSRDESAPPAARPPKNSSPPVVVTRTSDGRIVLSCDDPAVLDQLEELYSSIAPPARDHEVFYLKNVKSYWVWLNLKEYFKEELKDTSEKQVRGWYGQVHKFGESGPLRLSKPRKLNFIEDVDTNSILVVNATPEQLETVSDLIEIYDKQMDEDSVSKRMHSVYQVRYSKARVIADAIKEVYRDLLSSKDKEFQKGKGGEEQASRTETYVRIYDDGSGDDSKKKPSPVKAGFGGALSLGVDEISNTIIVSAQEELMPGVSRMIRDLDEAARPTTTVKFHHVGPRIDPVALQKALAETLSQPWTGGERPDANGAKPKAPDAPAPEGQPQNAQPQVQAGS